MCFIFYRECCWAVGWIFNQITDFMDEGFMQESWESYYFRPLTATEPDNIRAAQEQFIREHPQQVQQEQPPLVNRRMSTVVAWMNHGMSR